MLAPVIAYIFQLCNKAVRKHFTVFKPLQIRIVCQAARDGAPALFTYFDLAE
jgi:hypothetical protein